MFCNSFHKLFSLWFGDRFSFCSSGCPGTWGRLSLYNTPVSASQPLELRAWATISSSIFSDIFVGHIVIAVFYFFKSCSKNWSSSFVARDTLLVRGRHSLKASSLQSVTLLYVNHFKCVTMLCSFVGVSSWNNFIPPWKQNDGAVM